MSLTDHDTAAELSATAADIAAAISDGRAPAAADLDHARDMLETLSVLLGFPPGPAAGLAEFAETVTGHLAANFAPATLPVQQVLALAEEAGEFTAAYRRWAGMARRPGTWADVRAELADVVITAYVTARVLGIDLDDAWHAKAQIVLSRGWRQETPATTALIAAAPCRGSVSKPDGDHGASVTAAHATATGPGDPAEYDIAAALATAAERLADAVDDDRPGWLAIARETGDLLTCLVTARLGSPDPADDPGTEPLFDAAPYRIALCLADNPPPF